MTGIDRDTHDLRARLCDWIAAAPPGFVRHAETLDGAYGLEPAAYAQHEAWFEALALDLFAYQYARVPLYARLCEQSGRTPSRVRAARDIPYIAVEAFKLARLASHPAHLDALRFHTSGTTASQPGVHALWTPDLYDIALARAFQHHVLPDMDRVRMIRVVPAFREASSSSLAYMLEHVCERFGTSASRTFASAGGLRESELLAALAAARADGEPVCLLGTTLAWAHGLEACARRAWSVELPRGSRLMHTGGDKGRRIRVSGDALLQQIEACFGIPRSHVVGEYGMTELGSQCYTLGLQLALRAEPDRDPQRWSYPFWLRPRLVDAETGG